MILNQFPDFYSNIFLLIKLVLMIAIPLVVLKIITKSIKKFEQYNSISKSSLELLSKIIRYIIFIIILIGILNIFGIDLQSILVSVGIVSLAVTLAAKDTLSNVISGITILLEKKFIVGDMIEIDGHKGQVKKIGFKSVELYYKKKYMTVPNVLFTTKPFINHTRNGYYAVYFDVRMLNRYDLDEKTKELEEILDESNLILQEPKYLIIIKNITTTGVDIRVKVYINNPLDETKVRSLLIKEIKRKMILEDIDQN